MIRGLAKENVYLGDKEFEIKEMTMDKFDEFLKVILGVDSPNLDILSDMLIDTETMVNALNSRSMIKKFVEFVVDCEFGEGKLENIDYGDLPFRQVREVVKVFFSLNEDNLIELKMLFASLMIESMKAMSMKMATGFQNSKKNKMNTPEV